ncbi:MAG: hypothetical protein IPH97_11050 [Ignavibacteriales bacterium]|nr:hypothetical protein [Ignavibacteriales bacterium]
MKLKYFLFLFLSFLIFNSSLLIGTVRYVSKTGISQPPYTSWATASDSIQKCINICSFGDTVYVANGVYKEQVVMVPGLSLIGSGIDSCIIDTRSLAVIGAVTVLDSCKFKNFAIIVSNTTPYSRLGIYIRNNNGKYGYRLVEYNLIQNAMRGIVSQSANSSILSNIIRNSIDGIEISGVIPNIHPKVIGNYISVTGTSIWLSFGSIPYITNNICIGSKGFFGGYSGLNEIYNNLFLVDGGEGVSLSDTVKFYNNDITFSNHPNVGILVGGNYQKIINNNIENTDKSLQANFPSNPTVRYNNIWNTRIINENIPAPDSTNIHKDPMFVNPDSMDFKLQMYSPLIDAGDPNILDKDGSRSDIGLFGGPLGEKYTYRDLAPKPPSNLTAIMDSGLVKLTWNKNTEADFSVYRVYRDTVPDFMYDTTKIIAVLSDTVFFDDPPQKFISGNYYYKITALDNTSNQSAPSEESHINITGIPEAPPIVVEHYRLLNNYPNPFNSSTIIPYRLKEGGYVKLYIYDMQGERVRVLVNEYQSAGYYEARFSPTEAERNNPNMDMDWHTGYNDDVASGIYLYQIMVRGEGDIPVFTDMGKMILLK